MPEQNNNKPTAKEPTPGGIETTDDNVKEAKTAEEATANCQDCGVKFMTPHKPTCPQAAMQNRIMENRKKEEAKKPPQQKPQELSVHEALDFIKAHLEFIGTVLSESFLAKVGHDNYIKLCDNMKGSIKQDAPSGDQQPSDKK